MTGRGLLHGVRVVDLATSRAELCGRLLADLGAEVIKVEPPGGAAARFLPPFEDGRAGDPEGSLYWAAVALGKQSVILDLDDKAERETLLYLIDTADVLVESFDPADPRRLMVAPDVLAKRNRGLIHVSVTPYGLDGPHAARPATDFTLEAAGGLTGLQGDGDRPPIPVGFPQASFHAGIQAAADAVIALNERDSSGLGQHLDVSMQAAVVWTLMNQTGYPPNTGDDAPTTGAGRNGPPVEIVAGMTFPALWPCKDGWMQMSVTLSAIGARTLRNVLQAIADAGELSPGVDLTWTETIAPGVVEPEDLRRAIDEIGRFFLRRTKAELADIAVERAMLAAPIRTVAELVAVPQLQARGFWVEVGGRKHPGAVAKLSRTPLVLRPAPRLGQHQRRLKGWLARSRVGPLKSRRVPRGRPFEGLKVADFAWVGVGPLIAKALADHGATVVHIESAARPDVLRLGPPFKDGKAGIDRSQFFANFNSSKLGLTLNLATEDGRAIARRLVAWANVVVESFSQGTLADFGLDYSELSKTRPDLIMLSTCLCGQTGPHRLYRGFGTQGSALAGIHGLTSWPDRPPRGTWGAYTDFIAPRYGVATLASAIYERRRSGKGQHIDLSQVEAGIHFIEPLVLDWTANGRSAGPAGHESRYAAPHGVYQTEGVERYVAIACETAAHWTSLRGVAPLGSFAAPAFDELPARLAQDVAIDAVLAGWCRDKEPFELVESLATAGVPAAVVQRPSDLYRDPQLAHRGFFVTCEHGVMGPTPYDGPVTRFSATRAQLRAAPCLGEHTEAVMCGILGYTSGELAEYVAAGVLE